jgi:hypothetical protein
VEKINDFLASVWLKAAWLAGSKRGLPKDRSTICVSEYRSSWSTFSDSDLHFHLKFDAPQIKALCGSEAVVFFSIDEVLFSDIPEFSKLVLTCMGHVSPCIH